MSRKADCYDNAPRAIAIDGSKKATNSRDLTHVQENRTCAPSTDVVEAALPSDELA